MDRAEATGFGVAVAGHAALLAALSLGFANAAKPPILSQPMEVSFVEDIGLENATPEPVAEPAAASVAPEVGPVEETAPQPSEVPAPPEPLPPPPKPVAAPPEPAPTPRPAVKPAPAKPAPKAAPVKPAPAKAAPPAKASPSKATASANAGAEKARGSRLGRDFLKGLGSDPVSKSTQAPGAVMSAQALAGIQSAIQRQIQPCADRQVNPGPGANKIRVKLNLRLERDGSLAARPTIVSTSGVDAANERYEKRVTDLAIAAYVGCSPLRGLPEELYQTPKGGWSNLAMTYSLP